MSITKKDKEFLWVEAYRPQCIDDCILPERMKGYFREMVAKGQLVVTFFVLQTLVG